jgi:hypothetical protein
MSFNPGDAGRSLLAALADVLIPAGKGFPPASQAGVSGKGLDQVLAARPDLADGLERVLEAARGRDPVELIAELKGKDPAAFAVLAELVPAAYFMNPEVQRAIGYNGQRPKPMDPQPDYLEDGLLQSVIDRGPIYRPTPAHGIKNP